MIHDSEDGGRRLFRVDGPVGPPHGWLVKAATADSAAAFVTKATGLVGLQGVDVGSADTTEATLWGHPAGHPNT